MSKVVWVPPLIMQLAMNIAFGIIFWSTNPSVDYWIERLTEEPWLTAMFVIGGNAYFGMITVMYSLFILLIVERR